ncbi:hypothetical protein BFP78_07855 [Gaetbulibacter sp. 5U11]|nr:hypothetical protein BFP78_07855 [Gaetbulibacter sp. 5U11]
MKQQTIEEGKSLAVLSYLTIIGSVIAIIMNGEKKNDFTSFHNRQGLGLCLLWMIIGYFVSQFDNMQISIAFWVSMGALLFLGVITAINGTMKPIPFVGPIFQKLFKGLGN